MPGLCDVDGTGIRFVPVVRGDQFGVVGRLEPVVALCSCHQTQAQRLLRTTYRRRNRCGTPDARHAGQLWLTRFVCTNLIFFEYIFLLSNTRLERHVRRS
jgi:hypothetical protein